MRVSRRRFLGFGVAIVVAGTVGYVATHPGFAGETLDPAAVQRAVASGALTLIDVRRPDEWAETGIAKGAIPLDMREKGFAQQLLARVNGNKDAPIAIICARGVRSARVANALQAAGFTHIVDVPEGMLGSSAGPGWLERDLPVSPP